MGMAVLLSMTGCSSLTSQSWRGDREWRYQPPSTGTNVGRWVAVDSAVPKSKKPKKAAKQQKREQPRDMRPAPPADRFR